MTPFEARGWTKDTKFKVTPDEWRVGGHKEGTIVWLMADDGTDRPAFTDGTDWYYYAFRELEPIVSEETDRSNVEVNKDTTFNLKLTGEELVYLAVGLDQHSHQQPTASKLDNSIYCKVANILLEFADVKPWIWDKLENIDDVINKIFPPQESPEQKQYKELLAQREALGAQLAQLSQKLNLKEKIGDKV